MAESQVPYPYTPARLAALRAALSETRFDTYLTAAGYHVDHAVGLYLYNARLAKALLYPLHMVEVVLRNGIDALLVEKYGADWPREMAFRALLPAVGVQAIDTAITRIEDDKKARASREQIVAALTFDFWSNLFRPDYDRPLWQVHLRRVLPHLAPGLTRADVQILVREINRLRNRVAHHEPVLGLDLNALHKSILDMIAARDPEAADWTRHHSTLGLALRSRPTRAQAFRPVLGDVADRNFLAVSGDQPLLEALDGFGAEVVAIVRTDVGGAPTGAVTPVLLDYIVSQSKLAGGMIDLTDHDLDDVVQVGGLQGSWIGMTPDTPVFQVVKGLQADKVRVVVAADRAGVTGVIARAHRRY
ncbi:hypothetical protein QOZ96_002646 [Brevundimonas nasdae]|uniref:hypothetical protein n=1 Tax=Brevundimonas nasdae TaxID=172043 RepID=UPI001912D813|nr:hypothetical protein [Brevundimonas nasdae]MBK6025859.1 hypothetical protein [Brevundimonas nasdae]MDQ0452693.1 hypothetical protein [Brevundimonas nasdae]